MSHDCDDNHPTPLTRFPDLQAFKLQRVPLTHRQLANMLASMAPKYLSKDLMPLISGMEFGNTTNAKGCYRHDGNLVLCYVATGDIDTCPFTIEEAKARLDAAGIAYHIYTTSSHMVPKGAQPPCARFRVLLPLSKPGDHALMILALNRLNALMGGCVGAESWKPAQSFYLGRLVDSAGVEWFAASGDGRFIDEADDIAELAPANPVQVKAFAGATATATATASTGHGGGSAGGFSFPTAPVAQPAAGRGRPNKQTAFMIGRMKAKGLFLGLLADGTVNFTCPFANLHSTPTKPGDTQWYPPHTLGYSRGHIKCLHTNHGGRVLTDQDYLDALDIPPATPANSPMGPTLAQFIAVRATGRILHLPTMMEWPRDAVDSHVPRSEWPIGQTGDRITPSVYLTRTEGVPAITQYAWLPGEATPVIHDALERDGRVIPHQGSNILNLWRAIELPPLRNGIFDAEPWLDHWKTIYPDGWLHAVRMLAFAMQNPGIKINHGLALTGPTRIGKDSGLKPLAVWLSLSGNWKEATPAMMLGTFNEHAMTKFLRLNEIEAVVDTRGRATYVVMYDHLKIYFAAPPERLPINRKGLAVLNVPNVVFLIITSNNVETVLNLIPDDQRAYVLSTSLRRDQMPADYHTKFHAWLDAGGSEAVIHYLMSLDVSDFDPSAPPPMTDAKHQAIQFAVDPLETMMADLLDAMGRPAVVDVPELARQAMKLGISFDDVPLNAPKYRMRFSGWLHAAGYTRVTDRKTTTGHFIVKGKRLAVFVRDDQLPNALEAIRLHYGA